MSSRIAVLLPTHNGEKYLPEQLDSLMAQTYENLVLVLRDDGSSDDTPGIIRSHHAKFPDKFHVIDNDGRNLGAGRSFSFLMDYVLAHKEDLGLEKAYMMFCDQDDVWDGNKAAVQMQHMQAAEGGDGTLPVLVHSDLKVISESGDTVAASFMKYQGLNPKQNAFGQILFCNVVTGCTALINEALATRALPIPAQAVMHDWWLALVAAAFGKSVFIDIPLVEYRQHSSNTFGAIEKTFPGSLGEWAMKIRRMEPDPSLHGAARQASAFLEQYREELRATQKIRLRLASVLSTRSGITQKTARWLGRRF